MRLTPGQLNRATLERQLLLRREPIGVVDGVRRIVAIQAQEPASPYVALWNRLEGFDPSELDAAFATAAVVKASLMRITLHAVHADDHPTFHEAMTPTLRAARLNDRRFRATGLTIDEADALVPALVERAGEVCTKDDIERLLGERLGGPPHEGVWWALRTYAPLVHAPTGGPWSFGRRPSYRAAPQGERPAPDAALDGLVRRYLAGFGPASARDVAQFALRKMSDVRPALARMADTLTTAQGPDGDTLFDVPGAALPDEDTPAPPRLLAMWDSILLAHADRSRIIPEEHRAHVIRRNGDVLPTLLVDGRVAGVWRPIEGGIEARAFHPLDDATWDGLAAEAASLVALLADREPDPYRRYARWWEKLPDGEVTVLAG
ncbi:MAG: winged helix DNA-binding domain-containing protein [Actinomycetota bacterium]|nr:winged helix DNA-binding domain-containing protein [Actinomycetota bacterium]